MTGARALVETITAHNGRDFNNVRSLQELHAVEQELHAVEQELQAVEQLAVA
jgi:hypothetical protein